MSVPVHFFDIKSSLPGSLQCWSPNTVKTRILLNYRRIPYTEEFISYPDIEPLSKSLGLPPAPPGFTPYYLPTIVHSSVPTHSSHVASVSVSSNALSDSFPIAVHLEQAFPPSAEHPAAFPTVASHSLALLVQRLVSTNVIANTYNLVLPGIPTILDERGEKYFVRTRTEDEGGIHPKDLAGDEKNQSKLWHQFEKSLVTFLTILQGPAFGGAEEKGEARGPYLEGKVFGYADAVLLGIFVWWHRSDKAGFERIMALGGGEFRRMWDASEQWVEGQGEAKIWQGEWEGKGGGKQGGRRREREDATTEKPSVVA